MQAVAIAVVKFLRELAGAGSLVPAALDKPAGRQYKGGMPLVVTESAWRLLNCEFEPSEDPISGEKLANVSMAFESAGQVYAITVTGPRAMMNTDVINVCRAAAAKLIAAAGGDPSVLMAREVSVSDLRKPDGEKLQ